MRSKPCCPVQMRSVRMIYAVVYQWKLLLYAMRQVPAARLPRTYDPCVGFNQQSVHVNCYSYNKGVNGSAHLTKARTMSFTSTHPRSWGLGCSSLNPPRSSRSGAINTGALRIPCLANVCTATQTLQHLYIAPQPKMLIANQLSYICAVVLQFHEKPMSHREKSMKAWRSGFETRCEFTRI
jgi:hypothetical protein